MGTAISLAAVVISAMSFGVSSWRWRRERADRQAELAEERKARLLAEANESARRHREQNDVVVTVRHVISTQTGLQEPWWRLQIAGGNGFSRALVTQLWLYVGEGRASTPSESATAGDGHWEDILASLGEFHLVAGQQRHIKAARGPSLRDEVNKQVYVKWTTGELERSSLLDANLEPWQ